MIRALIFGGIAGTDGIPEAENMSDWGEGYDHETKKKTKRQAVFPRAACAEGE